MYYSVIVKDHSIGLSNSASAKSSNFKHPYAAAQNFTTVQSGASVTISYSCEDHKGVKDKLPPVPACLSGLLIVDSYRMFLGYCQVFT